MILRSIFSRNFYIFVLITGLSNPMYCMESQKLIISLELTNKISSWIDQNFEHDPINENYVCIKCCTINDSKKECFAHYGKEHEPKCLVCDVVCKTMSILKNHLKNDPSEEHQNFMTLFFQYPCSNCNAVFLDENGRRIHKGSCNPEKMSKRRNVEENVKPKKIKLTTNEKLSFSESDEEIVSEPTKYS